MENNETIKKLLEFIAECDDYMCLELMFEKISKELPHVRKLANEVFRKYMSYDFIAKKWIDEG